MRFRFGKEKYTKLIPDLDHSITFGLYTARCLVESDLKESSCPASPPARLPCSIASLGGIEPLAAIRTASDAHRCAFLFVLVDFLWRSIRAALDP
jgi:hypothetical protein